MKINMCDICYMGKENKLAVATMNRRISNLTHTRIDYCKDCESKIPQDNAEYLKFRAEIWGRIMSDEEVKELLKG